MGTRRKLIERAIAIAGSEKKLGERCGCSQHKIWKAKVTEKVDAELALKIERAVGGAVTAAQLRPDLPWPSPSDARDAVSA
jgi:DNA-binding transcriptional regulator YdaS (Cro superfamily)